MPGTLKSRTLHALSWSAVQEFSQRGLQFVISIVLARLLLPEQFGLIAMLTVFIAVSQALLDSGFGAALIQKKNPTELDKCSVFYLNVFMSFALAGLLCLVAPWIAHFYRQPQLTDLTRALSLLIIINGFVAVQNALVIRSLNFRRQTVIITSGTLLGGLVGLVMAWRGYGVWSLVAQQLISTSLRGWLYWAMSDWRPKLMFSFQSLHTMFGFGSRMAASSVLNTVFDNLYSLVIGKLFSAASLGFYSRAQTLKAVPAQSLGMVVARVTLPVFSKLQDEPERFRRGLRQALTTAAFLQFPIMIGLAAIAEPLVLVLLTEKWAPCIPYLQVLSFVGLWFPLHSLNLNALVARGRSDLFFRLEVVKKVLIVLNILITYRWGVFAMVCGQSINGLLGYFINSYYSRSQLGYSTWQQVKDMSPYLGAAGVMGLAVAFLHLPTASQPVQLGFKVVLGVAIYAGLAVVFRFQALQELVRLIRQRRAAAPIVKAPVAEQTAEAVQ
jgi:O-antigen/teichoic acid export membrane protein